MTHPPSIDQLDAALRFTRYSDEPHQETVIWALERALAEMRQADQEQAQPIIFKPTTSGHWMLSGTDRAGNACVRFIPRHRAPVALDLLHVAVRHGSASLFDFPDVLQRWGSPRAFRKAVTESTIMEFVQTEVRGRAIESLLRSFKISNTTGQVVHKQRKGQRPIVAI